MQLSDLFELFMRERTYLKNASPLSIKFNKHTWLRWIKAMGEDRTLEELSKELLNEFVIKLRELPLTGIS